jgi:hypothetical protein
MLAFIVALDAGPSRKIEMRTFAKDQPCKQSGCSEIVGPSGARGLCSIHYQAVKKVTGNLPKPTEAERFWAKVEKTDGCWNWTASKNENGYGSFGRADGTRYAHRVVWEMTNGPIPSGMLIDHTCFNHACVNPSHLRLVTQKQNQENRAGQRSDNTSGYRGVCWKMGRWSVDIYHNGKAIHAGRFKDINDANKAAIAARNEIFTHNNLDRIKSQEEAA